MCKDYILFRVEPTHRRFGCDAFGLVLVEVVGDDRLRLEADLARIGAEEAANEQAARNAVEFVAFDGFEEWNLDLGAGGHVVDRQADALPCQPEPFT